MSISESVSLYLCNKGIVEEENQEIVSYGIHHMWVLATNFLTFLAIGFCLNQFWQTVLLLIAFTSIRTYAGGYHAPSRMKCYFYSTVLIAVGILIIKYIQLSVVVELIILIASIMVIFILSPMADENKPLSDMERIIYKRKTMIHCLFWVLIYVALYVLQSRNWGICIVVAFIQSASLLVLKKCKSYNNIIKK